MTPSRSRTRHLSTGPLNASVYHFVGVTAYVPCNHYPWSTPQGTPSGKTVKPKAVKAKATPIAAGETQPQKAQKAKATPVAAGETQPQKAQKSQSHAPPPAGEAQPQKAVKDKAVPKTARKTQQ